MPRLRTDIAANHLPSRKALPLLFLCTLLCALTVLVGCGGGGGGGGSLGPYETPIATYNGEAAQGSGGCAIDLSNVELGWAAAVTDDVTMKLQVLCNGETYNYSFPADGSPLVVPMNCGDGTYKFRFMSNVGGDQYVEAWSTRQNVTLQSEQTPFLYNNYFVNYNESSKCVAKAREIRSSANSELELVTGIYDFITSKVKYDHTKAAEVQPGYVPTPDETLATGKGICFDYASLAAAMMRSQGIPCQLVTGNVDPDNIYHAWNVIYFREQGWVSVEIAVEGDQWKRIDLTFGASEGKSGADNPSRAYTNRYIY